MNQIWNHVTTHFPTGKIQKKIGTTYYDDSIDQYANKISNVLVGCKAYTYSIKELNQLLVENGLKEKCGKASSTYFLNIDGNFTNFDLISTELKCINHKFTAIGLAVLNFTTLLYTIKFELLEVSVFVAKLVLLYCIQYNCTHTMQTEDLMNKASTWLGKAMKELNCSAPPNNVKAPCCRRLNKKDLVVLFSEAYNFVRLQNDRLRYTTSELCTTQSELVKSQKLVIVQQHQIIVNKDKLLDSGLSAECGDRDCSGGNQVVQ